MANTIICRDLYFLDFVFRELEIFCCWPKSLDAMPPNTVAPRLFFEGLGLPSSAMDCLISEATSMGSR